MDLRVLNVVVLNVVLARLLGLFIHDRSSPASFARRHGGVRYLDDADGEALHGVGEDVARGDPSAELLGRREVFVLPPRAVGKKHETCEQVIVRGYEREGGDV